MPIIDSQVHVYAANTPERPWFKVPPWPDHVTGDEMVAAMDALGVDGAIFVSAFSMYRYDASYAVEVQNAHPGRFALVKPVDPTDPAVAEVISEWKNTAGTVGIRIMYEEEAGLEPGDPGVDLILREAVRHDFPVNILCWENLDATITLVDRHPDTRFVIDHLGILPADVSIRQLRHLDRPAESARARQPGERGDQGQRRLHPLPCWLPLPGHLGPSPPCFRRLGS